MAFGCRFQGNAFIETEYGCRLLPRIADLVTDGFSEVTLSARALESTSETG